MTAFTTPKQMFREYQLDAHFDYMADRQDKESQTLKEMDVYAKEAVRKIEHYCELIAEAYVDGCKMATKLWESKGLKMVHAYAVLDDLVDFLLAFDDTERNDPDWDIDGYDGE